jgi:hypothetical protein
MADMPADQEDGIAGLIARATRNLIAGKRHRQKLATMRQGHETQNCFH